MTSQQTADEGTSAYVVVIRAGSIYRTTDLQALAKSMSTRFSGEIWARGPRSLHAREGRFEIFVMGVGLNRYLGFLRQLVWVFRRCLRIRSERRESFVVGSYDPFREGLLAMLASRVLYAPYWVELNGCYGDAENYRDSPDGPPNLRKKWLMTQIARVTTANAAVIKMLFPEQEKGFLTSISVNKTMVFPNLLDLEAFRPIEEQQTVLFLGFPFYLKGVDVLLDAFVSIAPEFPEWRLRLVGHELQKHCSRWLPHPQIDVEKAVFRDKVPDILGRCGILVLPSRSEALGRVLIEAAACGKARIASRVGGNYMAVTDSADGILVEPGNSRQLASALRLLMSDAKLRSTLGAAARRRVAGEWTSTVWLENMSQLIVRCRPRPRR